MSHVDRCPQVPVSWGELMDKITILQIKTVRITAREARANVAHELAALSHVAGDAMRSPAIVVQMKRLRAVNEELWGIEDDIRACEAEADFGPHFVQLARAVYKTNDLRAAIKRQINDALGSQLVEEKSYADWTLTGAQGRAQVPAV